MTSVEITFLALNVAAIVMLVSFVVHLIVLHQTKYELAGYLVQGEVFGESKVALVRTSLPEAERLAKVLATLSNAGSIVTTERIYRVANR